MQPVNQRTIDTPLSMAPDSFQALLEASTKNAKGYTDEQGNQKPIAGTYPSGC